MKHGVPPTGMQPQSKPPDTQISPAGQAPSHVVLFRPPHGCVPATHGQVPPTFAQTGVSAGHSPQQVGVNEECGQPAGPDGEQ